MMPYWLRKTIHAIVKFLNKYFLKERIWKVGEEPEVNMTQEDEEELTKILNQTETLTAFVSIGGWSYIVNNKGNGFAATFEEYGSYTPANILQEWLDKLPKREWNMLYKKCDELKEKTI